jgi:hypothetical protein
MPVTGFPVCLYVPPGGPPVRGIPELPAAEGSPSAGSAHGALWLCSSHPNPG